MAHDIFVSHSSKDKQVADALCATLEQNGIRCWIAPRDILPGRDWTGAITAAIIECKALVLIFSHDADQSLMVLREVGLALSKGRIIVPFRLDGTLPTGTLEFCLANTHWLDALTPPLEEHLLRLVTTVNQLFGKAQEKALLPASYSSPESPRETVPPVEPIDDNRNPKLIDLFRLRVIRGHHNGEVFPLGSTRITIGRNPASDVCLSQESMISRVHCALNWDTIQRKFVFVDCGAANPALINGAIASTGTILNLGDVLSLGRIQMILETNE